MSISPINSYPTSNDFEVAEQTAAKVNDLHKRTQQTYEKIQGISANIAQRHQEQINRLNQNQGSASTLDWQGFLNRHKWTIGGLVAGISIAYTIAKIANNLTPSGLALNIAIVGITTLICNNFDLMNKNIKMNG